jgi:DNA (cytosine-5)-methyltransferase 1
LIRKLARLAQGARLRVMDLFSGLWGHIVGFSCSRFEITAAVESDRHAASSHGQNFHAGQPEHAKARDITTTTPLQLTQELGLGQPSLAFDVVVGGPPCQAFARVGRSKLREVADHPEAFRHDARARLYLDYLRYVEECAPLVVLMENVPEMLNHGGHNIAEEVCEVLESRKYL